MTAQPSDPLMFAGAVLIGLALFYLLFEAVLRLFKKQGLVQGAVPKRSGETFREHRDRNREYDARELATLRRRRPLAIAVGILGAIAIVIGIVR